MNNNQELKVLEFFGVPGVGKSYLVKKVDSVGTERTVNWFSQGVRSQRIYRKATVILRHFFTACVCMFWAIKLMALYPSQGISRYLKVLFNWVFIGCVIRDQLHRGHHLVVLDQGIAQALWSTQFGVGQCRSRAAVVKLVQRYLSGLSITDWFVVHVTASDDLVRKRVEQRDGFSPLDHDFKLINEANLAEQEIGAILGELSDSLNTVQNVSVKHLENRDEGVLRQLRNMIGGVLVVADNSSNES